MNNTEYNLNSHQERVLKANTVRIESTFIGSSNKIFGTGVIYKTTNQDVHYILTALHCLFGKRNGGTFENETTFESVKIFKQKEDGSFLEFKVKKEDIISFKDQDLALILIDFNKTIVGGETIDINDITGIIIGKSKYRGNYNSYGYPTFKENNPHELLFKHKLTPEESNFINIECLTSISSDDAKQKISGYSGAGIYCNNKAILYGIITQISDENGFASSIIAKKINIELFNSALEKRDSNLYKLECINDTTKITLEDDGSLINYEKIVINGIELNIWRALKRLKQDLKDDWFQDPLDFKYLLSKKNFYKRVKKYINKNNPYSPSTSAKHFTVPKSGYSTRPTIETSFIDRVIYQAYVDKLIENLDFVLSRHVYSFRYNSGKNSDKYMYHYSIEQWKKYVYQTKFVLTPETPFLVVADITSFFENINTKLLGQYLKTLVHDYIKKSSDKDEQYKILDSIENLIKDWNEKQINSEFGIPQNRDASSFLGNLYLNKIDQIMLHSNGHKFYYRYMDDIRIVCKTKAEAIKAIYDLSVALRELGLSLNSSKTTILDFNIKEDIKKINECLPESLTSIDQINSFLSSKRKRDVQIAVQMTYNLFKDAILSTDLSEEKYLQKRKLSFCIHKLQLFARTRGLKDIIDFKEIIKFVLKEFDNQPWLTSSFIKLLMAVDKSYFNKEDFEVLKGIIKNNLKNIYESQTYFIWIFLSYMKYEDSDLIGIATRNIKSTNQINQANTAGSYIYLASINWRNYKQVMISSFNKGNLKGNYFLQRNALIALRNVNPNEIEHKNIEGDLEDMHQKLYDEKKEIYVSELPELKVSELIKNSPTLISL
ncbi:RNA-directed DNA polymerase [Paenimyroides tangerinum]|uniref:RNA-directed DNA polymerase n=1 Tax=Paenimyroides tangerinum TaxID=2488728 RepID=A0A3P3VVR1_9FLAO|nr:RNA-directed DNA polymerase [Paenimyroides tangerinum]RRJ86881.1 RNA-directed DNA polymerase [Paenimyroides tangerinum]